MIGHPTLGADGEYFVTKVIHASSVDDVDARSTDGGETNYGNRFECLPLSTPWRPDRITQKPRIHSIQTAKVTGPVGLDIHTDPHGRIRVRFPWDRTGESLAGDNTRWIRVSQAWAGAGSPGFQFIPRVGMEVIVAFIDGDHITDVRGARSSSVARDQYSRIGGAQNVEVRGERNLNVVGADVRTSLGEFAHMVIGSAETVVGRNYHLEVRGGTYTLKVDEGECITRSRGPSCLNTTKLTSFSFHRRRARRVCW